MSKNLFETYKVNGRTYTDNLGINAMISIPKKQYIEYEQQNEEIERLKEDNEYLNKVNIELSTEKNRLNNIISELEKWLDKEKNQLKFEDDYDSAFVLEIVEEKLQELKGNNNGVWVNNLLEVIKENNIEFGSDKE